MTLTLVAACSPDLCLESFRVDRLTAYFTVATEPLLDSSHGTLQLAPTAHEALVTDPDFGSTHLLVRRVCLIASIVWVLAESSCDYLQFPCYSPELLLNLTSSSQRAVFHRQHSPFSVPTVTNSYFTALHSVYTLVSDMRPGTIPLQSERSPETAQCEISSRPILVRWMSGTSP